MSSGSDVVLTDWVVTAGADAATQTVGMEGTEVT